LPKVLLEILLRGMKDSIEEILGGGGGGGGGGGKGGPDGKDRGGIPGKNVEKVGVERTPRWASWETDWNAPNKGFNSGTKSPEGKKGKSQRG